MPVTTTSTWMTGRSKAELHFSGTVIDVFLNNVSASKLEEVVVSGDALCMTDGVLQLGDDTLALEFDQDVWHQDAAKDIRKTDRILTKGRPNTHVVRLRQGACPLLPELDSILNVSLVFTNSNAQGHAWVVALAKHENFLASLREPFKSRLRLAAESDASAQARSRRPEPPCRQKLVWPCGRVRCVLGKGVRSGRVCPFQSSIPRPLP